MKLQISRWKFLWCLVTGGGSKVVDYVLGLLKAALDNLGTPTKEKIIALLNFTMKALSVVKAVRVFIPVKWQIAYDLTVKALEQMIQSLSDLDITRKELDLTTNAFNVAYNAWAGPDDDTCIDCYEKAA